MFNQDPKNTIDFLNQKFKNSPDVRDANIKVLKTGYNFGDTAEAFTTRYELKPAKMPSGTYRNIMGNQAIALGLVTASKKSNLDLFYGSYPITPASDVLHFLSKYKKEGPSFVANSSYFNHAHLVLRLKSHDNILIPKVRGHSTDFWYSLQRLHDRGYYWNKKGLSNQGKKKVEALLKKYGNE